jgi:hypothetical protein
MMDEPLQTEDQVRQLLEAWRKRAERDQKVHYYEERLLKRCHFWFGFPAVILSASIGALLVLLKLVGEDNLRLIVGISGFVVAFLTGVQTFSKFAERAADHKGAAVRYGCISREIERLLALLLPPMGKADSILRRIERRLNAAADETPTVRRSPS